MIWTKRRLQKGVSETFWPRLTWWKRRQGEADGWVHIDLHIARFFRWHAWIWSCFNSIQVQDSPPKSTVFTVHPSFLIPLPPTPQFQILQSYIAALHSLYVPEGCQWGGNSILTNLTQFVERFPGCPSCAPWNIALLPRDPRKHCPLVAPGILGILGFHILAAARLEVDCSDPAIWCLCKKIGIKW